MRDQEKSNPSSPNIFQHEFLERLSELPRSGSQTSFEADHAGPWSVVKVAEGFALQQAGSKAVKAVFTYHETAHLAAAILPGIGRPRTYHTVSEKDQPGVIVEARHGKFAEKVGWMSDYSDELMEALHIVESLLRYPASLAQFLQAANFEALAYAGGITAGRIFYPDHPPTTDE